MMWRESGEYNQCDGVLTNAWHIYLRRVACYIRTAGTAHNKRHPPPAARRPSRIRTGRE